MASIIYYSRGKSRETMVFRCSPGFLSFEEDQHYLLFLRKITGDYGLQMEPGLPLF
jgi:hypothetical protein